MKHMFLPAVSIGLLIAGPTLKTDYSKQRSLRIESEVSIEMETTNFEMERDGEPVNFGGMGGQSSQEKRRTIEIDTVLEHKNGKPTLVRREFEEVSAESTMSFGDESREGEHDCPLSGVTLELAVDEDGETTIEVVDGDEPDDEALLQRHRAMLALDALLPSEDVEVGDTWEVEARAVKRALGIDLQRNLFPRPEREEGEREGERGRRGRRGPGGGGGGAAGLLAMADWEGEATLASEDDEFDGQPCAVIEVTFEAAGDMPEPEFGGGGERRGRMPGLSAALAARPLASEYEISIEGRVYVSLKEGRPLGAELEGTLATDQVIERERGESTMVMTITREGTYERTVAITEIELEDDPQ